MNLAIESLRSIPPYGHREVGGPFYSCRLYPKQVYCAEVLGHAAQWTVEQALTALARLARSGFDESLLSV